MKKAFARVFFLIIGIGILIGSGIWFFRSQEFAQKAVEVQGRVIELVTETRETREKVGSSRRSGRRTSRTTIKTMYRPKVAFQTKEGKRIEFLSSVSSGSPKYQVNETVPVAYDPKNPYQAKINSWFALWGGPTILLVMGVVFTLPSLFLLVFGSG